ncbi:hypothetical protein FNF29_04676 [Cafeteria roenbergensis]|uniref:Uncharacterized protein n=1 Tax=Cafeteria roenbergensis TaxID=33653 RepID=A0A5A8CGE2_CAFRO|nr:hypothetical protein FNF29_04676 [Cafeteria roenbergensis]|eukprot:KAA0151200.1 hypothetical protein FNF29_04676 [Cafeteria roenbergensis]
MPAQPWAGPRFEGRQARKRVHSHARAQPRPIAVASYDMASSSLDAAALVGSHVVRHRVRFAPFFEPFDPLRRRRVTMEQAVRALASAGMEVPPGMAAALKPWAAPDGTLLYLDFLADVARALGEPPALEARPDFDSTSTGRLDASVRASGTMKGAAPDLSPQQSRDAHAALQRIAAVARARSVHLPSFLRQFDHSGKGVVTPSQLDRALSAALPATTAADRAALTRAFTWDAGSSSARVSARDLAAAVHAEAGDADDGSGSAAPRGAGAGSFHATAPGQGPAAPHPGLRLSGARRTGGGGGGGGGGTGSASGTESKEAEELPPAAAAALAAVRRQALERRVRLRDGFVDFDPLHRGSVTLAQFVRAIAALPFAGVSAAAIEALGRAFPDDRVSASAEPRVDYATVCDRVELAFGAAPGAAKDPTAEPPAYGAAAGLRTLPGVTAGSVFAEAARPAPQLSAEEEEALDRALRAIRVRVQQRRVELVGVFKDYDRTHEEHVTASQFLRALRTLGLLPERKDEVAALLAAFQGAGTTRESRVNWRAFRDAVDDAVMEDATRQRQAEARGRAQAEGARRQARLAAAGTAPSDARLLLARLKQWAVRDNVRVGEFLRDADPLRRGAVSAAVAVAALSAAGFQVRAGDEASLVKAYPAPGAGLDAAGRPLLDWRALEGDVEAAFGPRGLEAMPDADVAALRADALLSTATLQGREAELGVRPPAEDASATLGRFTRGAGALATPAAMLAASAAASGGAGERLSPAQARELAAAMAAAGRWASTRRVDVAPFFLGYDKHHRGLLPEPQARRCVSTLGLPLSGRALELACTAFASRGSDGRSDFSWAWLAAALEAPEAVVAALPPPGAMLTKAGAVEAAGHAPASGAGTSAHAGGAAGPPLGLTLEAAAATGRQQGRTEAGLQRALEEVRRRCAARLLSLKEHFAAHDRLNHGTVSAVKMRAALATAGLSDLGPQTLAALEAGFRCDADAAMVDWRDLVEAVEGGGRQAAGLEKDPLATLTSHGPTRRLADGDVADSSAVEAASGAIAEVARAMRQRRVDLKSKLMDFDRQRRGTLPACRFKSVLASEFRTLPPKDMDLLAAAFASLDAKGMVAWRPFLAMVDSGESP